MTLIENALSRWSVLAGIFFTTVWGGMTVWWISLDAEVQSDILSDFGFDKASPGKIVAYVTGLAALTSAITLGLRMVKQKAKELDQEGGTP